MFEFCHFSGHFEWLNTKLLELIYIVSSDCRTEIFSYSFAVVYSAELSISLNDYCNLVDSVVSRGLLKLISFQTQH